MSYTKTILKWQQKLYIRGSIIGFYGKNKMYVLRLEMGLYRKKENLLHVSGL